jgi:hypothetical protein
LYSDGKLLKHAPDWVQRDREAILAAVYSGSPNVFTSPPNDKAFAIAVVKAHGKDINTVPYKYIDRDVVVMAVKTYPEALKLAVSQNIKVDYHMVMVAVKNNGRALKFVPFDSELLSDRNIVLAAVTNYGRALKYASSYLHFDSEIVLAAINNNPKAVIHLCYEYHHDTDLVAALVKKVKKHGFRYASLSLQSDKLFILNNVEHIPFRHLSSELRSDSDVIFQYLESEDISFLSYVSDELKSDKMFMRLLEVNSKAYRYASDKLKRDKEILLSIINVEEHRSVLPYIPYECMDDLDIRRAIAEVVYWKGLKFTTKQIRNDSYFVRTALSKHPNSFRYATVLIRDDREVALKCVRSHGHVMKWVSQRLSQDIDFIKAAITTNPDCWNYLSHDIIRNSTVMKHTIAQITGHPEWLNVTDDREFVYAAVRHDGLMLQYAVNYQNDIDIVLAAINNNVDAYCHVNRSLVSDNKDVIRAAGYRTYFLSKELMKDKDFVIECLQKSRYHLFRFLPLNMQLHKDNIMASIATNILTYDTIYHSDCTDRELLLLAAKHNNLIRKIPDQFQDDRELLVTLLECNAERFKDVSTILRHGREMLLTAVKHGLLLKILPEE